MQELPASFTPRFSEATGCQNIKSKTIFIINNNNNQKKTHILHFFTTTKNYAGEL